MLVTVVIVTICHIPLTTPFFLTVTFLHGRKLLPGGYVWISAQCCHYQETILQLHMGTTPLFYCRICKHNMPHTQVYVHATC